ncbi:hypothetical protein SAMN02745704_01922 [Paucidesulfovibrio gracilis DSM 16080]|jgi:hypothetical protein|uniref:DUF985 domain-containing protein n=1 Tax=Paucidesulfovibrio gracilis DSM 16080 TaxID=1121449 RepID=A0A1T4X864_9BACT|nr:cupin domain-containing protein [Paucidesulfovibrio gracilis]SKA85794.1 hypothetical protein SAMN02745704_01922 [Paucidesulfovibrio gracilis DSM 16080]
MSKFESSTVSRPVPEAAQRIIRELDLVPHPEEGGFFTESYRSAETLLREHLPSRYAGPRCMATAIYYLLTPDTFSALHRLESDEIFHLYAGGPVRMLQLDPGSGKAREVVLGMDLEKGERPQVVVPRGVWQGSCLDRSAEYALLGCTVAPGFEYADYEHGSRSELAERWPGHAELIHRLTT